MSFHLRHQFLLSNLKTLSWWPPGWQTGAYPIELIGRRLIVKVNEQNREIKLFFSANQILTLQGNIINSRMTKFS